MKTLADELRLWRKRNGNLSQRQAARHLELPQKTLENWEQDRYTPSGFTLRAIRSELAKPLQTLVPTDVARKVVIAKT